MPLPLVKVRHEGVPFIFAKMDDFLEVDIFIPSFQARKAFGDGMYFYKDGKLWTLDGYDVLAWTVEIDTVNPSPFREKDLYVINFNPGNNREIRRIQRVEGEEVTLGENFVCDRATIVNYQMNGEMEPLRLHGGDGEVLSSGIELLLFGERVEWDGSVQFDYEGLTVDFDPLRGPLAFNEVTELQGIGVLDSGDWEVPQKSVLELLRTTSSGAVGYMTEPDGAESGDVVITGVVGNTKDISTYLEENPGAFENEEITEENEFTYIKTTE